MDQSRLERIRLLSARFYELQGLRVALAGGCIAVVMGLYLIAAPAPTGNGAMVALLVSFVPVIAGMPRLDRYYATTFGRQVWSPPKYRLLILACFLVVGWSLNTWIPSISPGGPTVWIVALASLWVAIRDWPWRAYYLGVTLAVAAAFTATTSGAGLVDDPGLTLGVLFLTVGVSMVAVGVLDHLLLVKLMKEVRQPEAANATRLPGADD